MEGSERPPKRRRVVGLHAPCHRTSVDRPKARQNPTSDLTNNEEEEENRLRTTVAEDPADVGALLHLACFLDHRKQEQDAAETLYRAVLRLDPERAIAQNNLGFLLRWRHGEVNLAETAFREAIRIDPEYSAAYSNLGALLDQCRHDAMGAESSLREAIRLDPTSASSHNNLATVLEQQGLFDEAEIMYHRAAQLDPRDSVVHRNLAFFLRDHRQDPLGALTEAELSAHLLTEEIAANQSANKSQVASSGELFCLLGYLREHHAGDVRGAEEAYREAIRRDVNREDAVSRNNLAHILHRERRQPAEAVEMYREAISINSCYAIAFQNLGSALLAINDEAGAEAAFREAVRLDPQSADHRVELGWFIEFHLGDFDAAEAEYRAALGFVPTSATAINNLGYLLQHRRGDCESAERLFREGISLNPTTSVLYRNLAHLLRERGQLDAATEVYQLALQRFPEDAAVHTDFGHMLFVHLHSFETAEAELREAVRLDPQNAAAHLNLGSLLHQLGKEGAEQCFREVVRIDPSLANGHNNLASILEPLQGASEEVERGYREAIRLGNNPVFDVNLGMMLHHRRMDPVAAEWVYRAAISKFPEHPLPYVVLSRLLLREREDSSGCEVLLWRAMRCPFVDETAAEDFQQFLLSEAGGRLYRQRVRALLRCVKVIPELARVLCAFTYHFVPPPPDPEYAP